MDWRISWTLVSRAWYSLQDFLYFALSSSTSFREDWICSACWSIIVRSLAAGSNSSSSFYSGSYWLVQYYFKLKPASVLTAFVIAGWLSRLTFVSGYVLGILFSSISRLLMVSFSRIIYILSYRACSKSYSLIVRIHSSDSDNIWLLASCFASRANLICARSVSCPTDKF